MNGVKARAGWILHALSLAALAWAAATPAAAEEAGSYLWRATTMRAAPGRLLEVIELMKERQASGLDARLGGEFPFIMRHSQGDQWDLLLLLPMESWTAYYAPERVARRRQHETENRAFFARLEQMVAFREDLFAHGPPLADVGAAFAGNRFYHVEMFEALAGKRAELLEQRRMENAYLAATGRTTNLVWTGAAGTDVDVFTIGFYPSLVAFAAPSPATAAARERAATEAGFESRSFIGAYLRTLISGHHDTLAVAIE